MSTRLKDIIDEIRALASDAESCASEAEHSLRRAGRLLEKIKVIGPEEAIESLKEAASLGLPALVAKYGHSSKEVKEVEEYIARKK